MALQEQNYFNFSVAELYEKILSNPDVKYLQLPVLKTEDFATEQEKDVEARGLDVNGAIVVRDPVGTCPHPCRPGLK